MDEQIVFGRSKLPKGKCFKFYVTIVNYVSDIAFYLYSGNFVEVSTIGIATSSGDKVYDITDYAGADRVVIVFGVGSDLSNVKDPKLKLDIDCTDAQCSECFAYTPCQEGTINLSWYNDENGLGFEYNNLPLVHEDSKIAVSGE